MVPQATYTTLVECESFGAVLADGSFDLPGSSSPRSLSEVVPDGAKIA